MKLIDILIEETIKNGWSWPKRANCITQDSDREIVSAGCHQDDAKFCSYRNGWNLKAYRIKSFESRILDDDYTTAIITREQYEAALAAKNDGWIEWGGGECPVPCGTMVDVKHRCGAVSENQQAWPKGHKESDVIVNPLSNAGQAFWRHENSVMDIIAYRLHKPKKSEQVRADAWNAYAGTTEADGESDLNECIGQGVAPALDGLPQVGCVCERSWAGDEWQPCKILFTSNQLVVVKLKESGREDAYNIGDVTFRPIRTEEDKKRDAAIKELTSVIFGEIPDTGMATAAKYASRAYDAIAAGKIPGVKLED